jgi:hypothetical protein
MKTLKFIVISLMIVNAYGEDITIGGRTYTNISQVKVNAFKLSFMHDKGGSTFTYDKLPKDIQDKFEMNSYENTQEREIQAEIDKKKAERKQKIAEAKRKQKEEKEALDKEIEERNKILYTKKLEIPKTKEEMPPNSATIKGDDWFGATNIYVLEKLIQYKNDKDDEAFQKLMSEGIKKEQCTYFFNGDVVYFRICTNTDICTVRKKGSIVEYYTLTIALTK